jgi:hypothetical protein
MARSIARSFNSKRNEYLQKKGIQVHRFDVLCHTANSAVHEIVSALSLESRLLLEACDIRKNRVEVSSRVVHVLLANVGVPISPVSQSRLGPRA